MTSEPPTKRKRTAADEDSETRLGITKSKYWFDDGNIIIQVETTRFRVHRSMLCRHSIIFKYMFDMPQPFEVDQRVELDGCPFICLSDKASDFEYVMSTFYDNIRECDMRVPMSFDHCAALLRLGQKYDIGHLFDEGLQRFLHEFPCTLSKWDSLCNENPGREIAGNNLFYDRGMALAHELSIHKALPAICLSFIKLHNTSEILQKISVMKDRDLPQLQDLDYTYLLMQCLEGRDRILRRIHHNYQEWACSDSSSPIPDEKCTRIESCTSSRALAVMIIPSELGDFFAGLEIMDTIWLPSRLDHLLCKKCKKALHAALEQSRVDLWRDLPSIFGLGDSWEALEGF